MNKQLFGLLISLFFIAQLSAEQLFLNNEFGVGVRIKITYCRGSKTTRFIHFNHDIDVFLNHGMQADVDLSKTAKIRLQEVRIETPLEIIVITLKDNKIKLPNTLVIKKDGVYYNNQKIAEYKNRTVITKNIIAVTATKIAH